MKPKLLQILSSNFTLLMIFPAVYSINFYFALGFSWAFVGMVCVFVLFPAAAAYVVCNGQKEYPFAASHLKFMCNYLFPMILFVVLQLALPDVQFQDNVKPQIAVIMALAFLMAPYFSFIYIFSNDQSS